MRIFFTNINANINNVNSPNPQCTGNPGEGKSFFGGMAQGDYAFISLQNQDKKELYALWQLLNYNTDTNNTTTATFEEKYRFANGEVTLKTFCALNILYLISSNVSAFNNCRNPGFHELYLLKPNDQNVKNMILNHDDFVAYANNQKNLREIVYVDYPNNINKSDKDVQLFKHGDLYKIYNWDKDFIIGDNNITGNMSLLCKFNPKKYNDLLTKLTDPNANITSRMRRIITNVKDWLDNQVNNNNNNNEKILFTDFWKVFCILNQNAPLDECINLEILNTKTKGNINMKIENKIDEYINNNFKQIILTGAPGTGKTYSVKQYCKNAQNHGLVEFVQFHPSYDYSDFVEGLRPVILNKGGSPTFVRIDGVFKSFCRKVVEDNYKKVYNKDFSSLANEKDPYSIFEKNYAEIENSEELNNHYFIIDEINRSDLSKVFGELMYCLEDSYRGLNGKSGKNLINTQYCNLPTYTVENGIGKELEFDCFKNGFFIPKNIYIIGTMNDIDRSVEAFDFALRRRFEWVEIKANEVFFEGIKGMLSLNNADAQTLTDQVTAMNEVISSDNNPFMLTEAYHIGHAYFKKYDPSNHTDSLKEIFDTNITSILKEYTRGRNSKDVNDFLEKCRNALLG